MVKSGVDDGVRGRRARPQTLEIFKTPAVDGNPRRGEGRGRSVGAREDP